MPINYNILEDLPSAEYEGYAKGIKNKIDEVNLISSYEDLKYKKEKLAEEERKNERRKKIEVEINDLRNTKKDVGWEALRDIYLRHGEIEQAETASKLYRAEAEAGKNPELKGILNTISELDKADIDYEAVWNHVIGMYPSAANIDPSKLRYIKEPGGAASLIYDIPDKTGKSTGLKGVYFKVGDKSSLRIIGGPSDSKEAKAFEIIGDITDLSNKIASKLSISAQEALNIATLRETDLKPLLDRMKAQDPFVDDMVRGLELLKKQYKELTGKDYDPNDPVFVGWVKPPLKGEEIDIDKIEGLGEADEEKPEKQRSLFEEFEEKEKSTEKEWKKYLK